MPFSLGSVLLAQIIIEYLRIVLIHTKCLELLVRKKFVLGYYPQSKMQGLCLVLFMASVHLHFTNNYCL